MRAVCVALFLIPSLASAQPARLDSLLKSFEAQGFSGVVLVSRGSDILLHKAYGFADYERGVRNTTSTRFEMNSLTKTFTAAAILKLHSQGKLDRNDAITRFLGSWPPPKDRATIHHLALHTAGLVPDGANVVSTDRDEFVSNVKRVAAESVPGEKYRYTNAGYSVLAVIIEKASGMTFEQYLRQHLFTPAKLTSVHFRGERVDGNVDVAKGYAPVDGKRAQVDPGPNVWGTRGAGGITSTVHDMYLWVRALRAGKIIDAKMLDVMFHPWPNEGYGWHVEDGPYGKQIHKGGGSQSFASQIFYYPDRDVLIVWASNDLTKRWRADLNRAIPAALLF